VRHLHTGMIMAAVALGRKPTLERMRVGRGQSVPVHVFRDLQID
jgi:hypothetical protein